MIIGKRGGCDPCKNDWKAKLNYLWERYQDAVRTVRLNGKVCYPDGDGNVILPDVTISGTIAIWNMSTYWQLETSDYDNATITDKTTYYELEVS